MSILAIDPGTVNMGYWVGDVQRDAGTGAITVKTSEIGKVDLKGKAAYEGAVDVILSMPWLSGIKQAVVETQDVRNTPGRIVATAAYGVLRGKGIDCCFSGAVMKNAAIAAVSEQFSVGLEEKPTKDAEPDEKARRREMHAVNKRNGKAVARRLLDDASLQVMETAKDPRGRSKQDDIADAVLLGVGLWLVKNKTVKKASKKKI